MRRVSILLALVLSWSHPFALLVRAANLPEFCEAFIPLPIDSAQTFAIASLGVPTHPHVIAAVESTLTLLVAPQAGMATVTGRIPVGGYIWQVVPFSLDAASPDALVVSYRSPAHIDRVTVFADVTPDGQATRTDLAIPGESGYLSSVHVGHITSATKVNIVIRYQDDHIVTLEKSQDNSWEVARRDTVSARALHALADLNGDGLDDAVMICYYPYGSDPHYELVTLCSYGTHPFHVRRAYALENIVFSLACADVNGDMHPDVVCLVQPDDDTDATVRIFLGDGAGHLPVSGSIRLPTGGYPIACDDIDRDGLVDIAAPLHDRETVAVLFGSGEGSFEPPVDYVCGPGAHNLVASDLDADGEVDLLASIRRDTDAPYGIAWLRNAGGRRLGCARTWEIGGRDIVGLALSDVTGDGVLDLVGAEYDPSSIVNVDNVGCAPGNGAGGYYAWTPGTALPHNSGAKIAVAAGGGVEIATSEWDYTTMTHALDLRRWEAGACRTTASGRLSKRHRMSFLRRFAASDTNSILAISSVDGGPDTCVLYAPSDAGTFVVRGVCLVPHDELSSYPSYFVMDLDEDGRSELVATDFNWLRVVEYEMGLAVTDSFDVGGQAWVVQVGHVVDAETTTLMVASDDTCGFYERIEGRWQLAAGIPCPRDRGVYCIEDSDADGQDELWSVTTGGALLCQVWAGDRWIERRVGQGGTRGLLADADGDGLLDIFSTSAGRTGNVVVLCLNTSPHYGAVPPTARPQGGRMRVMLRPSVVVEGTVIDWAPRTSEACVVSVYNIAGGRLRRWEVAGVQPIDWDGTDEGGHRVKPGVYFVEVSTSGCRGAGKAVVVR